VKICPAIVSVPRAHYAIVVLDGNNVGHAARTTAAAATTGKSSASSHRWSAVQAQPGAGSNGHTASDCVGSDTGTDRCQCVYASAGRLRDREVLPAMVSVPVRATQLLCWTQRCISRNRNPTTLVPAVMVGQLAPAGCRPSATAAGGNGHAAGSCTDGSDLSALAA